MNVLVIAHQLPYPPETGGKIRHFQLYSRLARHHRITWISPIVSTDEPYITNVLEFCTQVISLPAEGSVQLPTHGWRHLLMRVVAHLHWNRLFEFLFGYVHVPGLMWAPATPERLVSIDQAIAASNFDVVICETIASVEMALRINQIPKIISLFDIQSELFRRLRHISVRSLEDRLFYLPELLKIRRYEATHYRGFSGAVTVSHKDRVHLTRLCPNLPSSVVDNGVDTEYFWPVINGEGEDCLVFVGHFGYPPNTDAADFFCRQILPLIQSRQPSVEFLAVGRDAPIELSRYPGVQVIGSVPDVRPYLVKASVVVIPLRAGSGTRIKILEAMAMGKAIVSTSLGAEGLEVENGKHLVIADSPAEFARAVIDLLSDRARRLELGRKARELVETKYGWDTQASKFEAFIAQHTSRLDTRL